MRILLHLGFVIIASIAQAAVSVEIDLSTQTAWILQDGQRIYESPISSGRTGYETQTGDFAVLEKDREHRSTLYGRFVAADGSIMKADAHRAMPVPEGATFEKAPMKWFVRFNGPVGMHSGRLPGYAASHGCVRLPTDKARLFYDIITVGTPVRVVGSTPRRDPKRAPVATSMVQITPPSPPARKSWFPWFRRSTKPSQNPEKQTHPGLISGLRNQTR